MQTAIAGATVHWALFTKIGIVPLAVNNELKSNFLHPAVGDAMLGKAEVLEVGRRVAYGVADGYMEASPIGRSVTRRPLSSA